MITTRHLPHDLRRARLLAARNYVAGTSCWKAILGGYWDQGSIVRAHMPKGEALANPSPDT